MLTTDFENILREAATEVTALDPDNLDVAEFRALRRAANRRLQSAWEYHFWPDLGRVEQRFYRYGWNSGTGYLATNEVYYSPTGKYYQALQASTNQAPADANGNMNLTYWEESSPSYNADTYSATGSYVQGSRVSYGDLVYQLFAAGPVTGVLPTDNTQWGVLTPFDKYIAYAQTGKTAIGVVAAAYSANPRTTTRGNEVSWTLSENGVQVMTPINFAWLEYRIRCPLLTGEYFDATATYVSGQQVYFSSTTLPGNFYTANQTTTAGQSPATSAAKWDVVALPLVFHRYLVHAVAADWIRGPGGGSNDDMTAQLALAQDALDLQKTLLVGQQGQRVKTVVRTR